MTCEGIRRLAETRPYTPWALRYPAFCKFLTTFTGNINSSCIRFLNVLIVSKRKGRRPQQTIMGAFI